MRSLRSLICCCRAATCACVAVSCSEFSSLDQRDDPRGQGRCDHADECHPADHEQRRDETPLRGDRDGIAIAKDRKSVV